MHGLSAGDRDRLIEGRAASLGIARAWRESADYRGIVAALTAASVDTVERMLAETEWDRLLAPLIEALVADPFFEPPFRIHRDAVRTGAVLVEAPGASISMSVIDGSALPSPATIVFPGYVTVTRYLKAGGATVRRWEVDPLTPDFSAATATPSRSLPPLRLTDDDIVRCDGRTRSHLLSDGRGPILALVATLRSGAAPLIREHRITDGALARVASADEAASRTEMLLTFLRRSGRTDASERFDAATRDPAFHTRWTAMREWLGLDALAALPRLTDMAANDPHPEVRLAATTTLSRIPCRA